MTAIPLPSIPFQPSYPELKQQVSASRAGARVVSTVEYGDSFWEVDMVTGILSPARRLILEAFIDAARGGMQTVLYTPRHSCVPKAYWGQPDHAHLANGSLNTFSGYVATVNGVEDGLTLSAGDLISMSTGDHHAMFRVVTGAVAAGSAITVTLNTPRPAYIALGATVRFKSPQMNMRLTPGSFSMTPGGRPSARFSLFQVPR